MIKLTKRIEELEEELKSYRENDLGYGIIELEEDQGWICIETPTSKEPENLGHISSKAPPAPPLPQVMHSGAYIARPS